MKISTYLVLGVAAFAVWRFRDRLGGLVASAGDKVGDAATNAAAALGIDPSKPAPSGAVIDPPEEGGAMPGYELDDQVENVDAPAPALRTWFGARLNAPLTLNS